MSKITRLTLTSLFILSLVLTLSCGGSSSSESNQQSAPSIFTNGDSSLLVETIVPGKSAMVHNKKGEHLVTFEIDGDHFNFKFPKFDESISMEVPIDFDRPMNDAVLHRLAALPATDFEAAEQLQNSNNLNLLGP